MFAAYADKGQDKNDKSNEPRDQAGSKEGWLSNSSFSIPSGLISDVQGISNIRDIKPKSLSKIENVRPFKEKSETESESGSSPATPCTPPSPATPCTPLSPATPPASPFKSSSSTSYNAMDSNRIENVGESSDDCVVIAESQSVDCQEIHRERRSNKSRDRSQKRESSKSHTSQRSRSPYQRGSKKEDREKRKTSPESTRRRSRSRGRSEAKGKHRTRSHSRKRTEHNKHSKYIEEKGRRRKRRRRSSHSCSDSSSSSSDVSDAKESRSKLSGIPGEEIYEDRTRAFGNLNVSTLSRPVAAWYHSCRHSLGIQRHVSRNLPSRKRIAKHRYYNRILKEMEVDLASSKASKENKSNISEKVGQIQGDVNDVEKEISKIRMKFNQDLAEDPKNIRLWKDFVQFQDVVHQFERIFRLGGGASGARVTSERKLSILDKALKENPMCEELLIEHCQLAESVLPSDKFSSQLKTWISKDPGNSILWEALIMVSQGSLSTCKVSAVKSIYQEALTNINSMKRGNTISSKRVEAKLIDLVLHLGLFLRQAGLLELMWALVNVYLEFNLAKLDPTKFHITSTIADHALTELEEAILGSQLPLPTLWLRVETLRAGTHWVPLPADADSEDPQRLVFPEDVNDLIHSINSPHLTFRLVTITLTLLKIPLLPWRQCAANAAGLHPLPWLLDGPEPLFASLLPLGTVEFTETSTLLKDASQLACGPQYLIARPGQDEYLDFLTQIFSTCSSCLVPSQQTYLLVWWLRFYRWLMQLERLGHCKLPKGRKKKMRAAAKDLLRQECNRSNYLLFKEFALLELENGSIESTIKVLQGSILALPASKPVPIAKDRASICALYHTLVEVHLSFNRNSSQGDSSGLDRQSDRDIRAEDRNKALCLLVSLGRGIPFKNEKPLNTDIAAALSKFHHVSREVLDGSSEEELDPFIAPDVCHLAPTFLVEWAACHGWLLFLSHSVWKASTMFENILSELITKPSENPDSSDDTTSSTHEAFIKLQREGLFEAYVSLLRHHSHETRGSFAVLRDVLCRALKEFPANLTLLAALADLETTSSGTGLPLWRLSKMFYDFDSAPAYALFVFVMRYRLNQQDSAARNIHILLNQGGPEVPDPNVRNRMSTLLKRLTKHPVMRRCPLLWRLRLQLAAAVSSNDAECCSTFYLALEDCPWVKALYMDIVQVLPTQLTQVQDLLVEKELRLHITPEELEILRVDS